MNDMMNPRRRGDRNGRRSEGEKLENPMRKRKEESMLIYDTNVEDVIEEEEGFIRKKEFGGEEDNIKDVVVVANDLCSSMIQTTLSADFKEDINTKSQELMSFGKKYYYQG
ncbi:hypothetical protein Tco_0996050 [Tanacetum coccineum]